MFTTWSCFCLRRGAFGSLSVCLFCSFFCSSFSLIRFVGNIWSVCQLVVPSFRSSICLSVDSLVHYSMSCTYVFQIVRLFLFFNFSLSSHHCFILVIICFFFFSNISLPLLTGAITVPISSQRKPSMLFRSMTLLSLCFCIFHTKLFTVRIIFSHCKRHHLKSRNFPTSRT